VRKLLGDYKIDFVDEDSFCGACVEGKQHSNIFLERKQRALEPGAIMHADLCGPMECASLSGAKYFLCITCDFSTYRMVYFLKEKSETSSKVEEVLKLVENHCGQQMKIFQCDGGTEFDNSTMQKLMSLNGVKLVVTNPYTPQQNGCAERSNRTITEMARTLLLAKNLPKFLWAEAVNTVVYTLNHTGPSFIEGKTPLELFVGKSTHLDKFHVFGTSCYVHVPKDKRKWDPKGKRGIFVGYSDIRYQISKVFECGTKRKTEWFGAEMLFLSLRTRGSF
jgi:hypothetical protein